MRFLPIFALVIVLVACSPTGNTQSIENLPMGDPAQGAELFNQTLGGAPPCSSCHTLDGTTLVGPSLHDFSSRADTRLSDKSAEEYTFTSITQPAAHIVSGFGNIMYNQYAQRLTPQQIADLVAYLLTL